MLFKTFGKKENPAMIILHGGGLSQWAVMPIVNILSKEYYIITPIIDGHGEDGDTTFISINDSAGKIIRYIDENHGGKVLAICGLSIGAQISLEVLASRSDICSFSVIESALIVPLKYPSVMTSMTGLAYPLIKKKWYSDLQAKTLLLPEEMHDTYYRDSCKITKKSLKNIIYSNSTFELSDNIKKTKSKTLIIVGGKELGIMKKSAERLGDLISSSEVIKIPRYGHGELSQLHPEDYCEYLLKLITS